MRSFFIAFLVAMLAPVSAESASVTDRACFASMAWDGWSAAKDGDALYLRVRRDEIYRVELTPGSRVRRAPGQFLISEVRGTNMICSALDLDLTLADTHGFQRPLFARSLRRLTPEEISALPADEAPS